MYAISLGAPRIAVAQSHVAVVHVDPKTYAADSYSARENAAAQFYQSHRDAYDFLITFPVFPVNRSDTLSRAETEGRHYLVRNAVSGIGMDLADVGQEFGSRQRLQGLIEDYALVPGDAQDREGSLAVIAHEVAHQWSGKARFRDPRSGQISQALLGVDGAHWSYYLDSDASVLYGADWLAGGGGTFLATAAMKRYSALDLYLMGFLAPDELGPITLLQPSSSETTPAASLPPDAGTHVSATPLVITASDLVAGMGHRLPASSGAQASFRAAFVIVSTSDPTQEQLQFVDEVRREWANRFYFMTRGRAVMQTELVEPPRTLPTVPSVELAIEFLLSHQQADGGWSDDPGTQIRDTQAVIEALAGFSSRTDVAQAIASGAAYLEGLQPVDVDQSARRVLALWSAGASVEAGAEAPFDVGQANADGGLGLAPGYDSTVIDTALAVYASSGDVSAAVAYLESVQGLDGGWGLLAGGPSDIETTALVYRLLARPDLAMAHALSASRAADYLLEYQRPGGRYVDPDSRDMTADTLLAFAAWGVLPPHGEAGGDLQVILSQQQADGSWEGSVERTAVALRVLHLLMIPNLAVRPSEIALSATSVIEGEPVTAAVLVRNLGFTDAHDVAVQAFDASGRPFGPSTVLPLVSAGGSAVATLNLDTAVHAGGPQAYVVVDPSGAIEESNEADNQAAIQLVVAPRPVLPDLYVASGSLSVSPSSITRVGTPVTVSAQVGNVGLTDVAAATVAVVSGTAVIATRSLALPAGRSQVVTLEAALPTAGVANQLTVVVDPDGGVKESSETNNSVSVALQVVPTVDLSVHLASVAPSPVDPGQDVTITFEVGNRGTTAPTGTRSRAEILDGAGAVLATASGPNLSVASAGTATGSIKWRAGAVPAAAVRVSVVQEGDLDPSDNAASGPLLVSESGRPNLAFRGAPVVVPSPPLEGRPVQVSVTVENAGRIAAGPSALELWIGDPATGGQRGPRVGVPALEAGAAATLSFELTAPGKRTVLAARVDPDDAVSEYDETDNEAVLQVEPLTRPDLAIEEGGVQPSSLFPRHGERVDVRVLVQNLGGQAAAAATLELFAGAPEAGGVRIGSTGLPGIAAHGSVEVVLVWDTSASTGSVTLVAVVNRDGTVEDADAKNDRSSRAVQVQAGDLAASNPYFSPNGDGIKDATEVFFRLDEPGAVDGVVRDERGRTVRVLHGVAAGDGSGALAWDGRTDAGAIAYDGTYRVAVQGGSHPAPLGEVAIVVDTDRSSVLEAPTELRAPVALDDFFRAQLPAQEQNLWLQLIGTPDERNAIYYYEHTKASGGKECAYYRVPLGGDVPELLTPPEFSCASWSSALSTDGTAIYRAQPSSVDGRQLVVRYDLGTQRSETVAELENRTEVDWFGPDETWHIGVEGGAVVVHLDTGQIETGAMFDHVPTWAAGGGMQAFMVWAPHGNELHVANADGSGERAIVAPYPHPVCVEQIPDGPCLRWEPLPIATPEGAFVLPDGASTEYLPFTWVSATELAFAADGVDSVWLLDVTTGEVEPIASLAALQLASPASLMADPPGRNLAIVGFDSAGTPRAWALNLASLKSDYTGTWSASLEVGYASTRFGAALIGKSTDIIGGPNRTYYPVSHAVALDSLGNLGLSLSGLRRSGSPEIVLRGTAADLNLDRWEITARERRGSGAFIPIASGTSVVVDGEFARWTAPGPGTWDLTLTGTDLAGNTRSVSSVASWGEVPAIANVRGDPRYFSPNGDGRQDAVTVSYSVQEPVSTALDVRSESGRLVRQLPVTHASTGTYSLRWDGTDAGGAVQADGMYTISATGSRAEVILDATPPAASLVVGQLGPIFTGYDVIQPEVRNCTVDYPPETLLQKSLGGQSSHVPVLAANLGFSVSDDHLRRWELQAAATPGFVEPIALTGGGASVEGTAVGTFPVSRLPGGWFRLQSSDAAGNQFTTPAVDLPEQLFVLAYGAAIWGDFACSGGVVPLARPSIALPSAIPAVRAVVAGAPEAGAQVAPNLQKMSPSIDDRGGRRQFCYERAYHAFAIASTIRAPLVGASVAYSLGAQRYTDQAHVRLMTHGAVLWDARTAPSSIDALEVQVTDSAGRVFVAPVEVASECPRWPTIGDVECSTAAALERVHVTARSVKPKELWLRDVGTGALLPIAGVVVTESSDEGGQMPSSYVSSGEVAIDELPGCSYEVVAQSPGLTSVVGKLDVCGLAQRHVEVVGDAAMLSLAARYRKAVSRVDLYLQAPRSGRSLVASVPGSADLSAPVALDLTPFPVDVPLALSARTVFTDGSAKEQSEIQLLGTCDAVSRIVRPGTQVQVHAFPRTPTLCAQRPAGWTLAATATSGVDTVVNLGLEVSRPGEVPVELSSSPIVPAASVSTVAIISGDAIGPGEWSATARATEASGRVIASAPVHFTGSVTPPSSMVISEPRASANACPVRRSDGRRVLRVEGGVNGEQLNTPHLFLKCGTEPMNPVTYAPSPDALGEIDVTGWPSRDCQLMVEVEDAAGASYCSAPTPFHLVGSGSIAFSTSPALFSPNGDGQLDVATLSLGTAESSAMTVTGTDSKGQTGTVLHTNVGAGTRTFAWDGTLGGQPAADGDVTLHAVAIDSCGNSAEALSVARLDSTPPKIQIVEPPAGAQVSGTLTLTGEVSDANLQDYDLAIGPGSSPAVWTSVATIETQANGKVGEIPTAGLPPGRYTVRVQARDRAGNRSVASVEVEVTSNRLIRSLAVGPALVSPNQDGILDASIAHYETLANATVSLDLVSGSGTVVHVQPPVAMPASAGDVDLLEPALAGMDDGPVVVRLTATAGSLVETEDALLTLDRVPPSFAIEEPAKGSVVAHVTAVRGSVADDHLEDWTLTLVGGGAATVLATGHAPAAGALATFPDLGEGEYLLVLEGRDGAGNPQQVRSTFSVDRTPPAVAVVSPVGDAWLTGRNGAVEVTADVKDLHLSEVRLDAMVEGADPRELFRAGSLPSDGHVTSWDLVSESDGPLRLRLSAGDHAGNAGEALVALHIDNTPPAASIAAPRDGVFVHRGDAITGVATDQNLAAWTLELTSGVPSSASIWVPLADDSQSVQDGLFTALASLPPDGTYGLRLTVTDLAGNPGVDVCTFRVDTTPPQPPASLVAKLEGSDVALTWAPSPDSDVVGYQVLRAGPTGAFAPVGGVVTGTATIDPQIADGRYRYAVVAIDAADLRSAPSPEARLDVDRTPPHVAIIKPNGGAAVSGTFSVVGTAYSDDFKELRLSVGVGSSPTEFQIVRRSGVAVVGAELGIVDASIYADGSQLTVRLEGEDLSGNTASETTTVTIDEAAPSAPVLIAATPVGNTIHLQWQPSPDEDVTGYVIFRNGSVASAPEGSKAASISAHLLPAGSTSWEDGPLPDGVYTYEVQAYDRALNASDLSNALSGEVETQAPHATVVSPEPLARLDGTVAVLAEVKDQDVASVQFEVRAGSTIAFQPLGAPVMRVPFTVPLDLGAYDAAVIELRAVATDSRGNTDVAPSSVFVFHAPTPTAPSVTSRVDGGDVHVSWSDPNAPGRIAGYEVRRDEASLLPASAAPAGIASASASTETAAMAHDSASWTAWMTTPVGRPWWRLDLETPTLVKALDLSLLWQADAEVAVLVKDVWVPVQTGTMSSVVHVSLGGGLQIGGVRVTFLGHEPRVGLSEVALDSTPLAPGPAWQDGGLARGLHAYRVAAVSDFGLRAAGTASARVYAPTLGALQPVVASSALHVTGADATPSSTVTVFRGGVAAGSGSAAADGQFAADITLVEGMNTLSARATDVAGNVSLPSAEVRVVYAPAPTSTLVLRLTRVHESTVELAFQVEGDSSRIAGFHVERAGAGARSTVGDLGPAERTFRDVGVPNGTYTYRLVAYNADGVDGAWSNPVEATVNVAPPAAVVGLSVSQIQGYPALRLRWSVGAAGNRYLVERAPSQTGPFVALNADSLSTKDTYVDSRLTPGVTYFYRVREVDASGNAGAASNVAWGTPLAGIPAQPVLFEPTAAGVPISVVSTSIDVSGLADPGVRVELRRNDVWVGEARSGSAELLGQSVASLSDSQGFGVSRDGETIAAGSWSGTGGLQVQGPGVQLSIQDAGLQSFGRVVFAPHGPWFAFEATASDDGRPHVWLASTEDGTYHRVSFEPGEEGAPAWSPDGSRLAYAVHRDAVGASAIGVLDVGSSAELLLAPPSGAELLSPNWTSTGEPLALAAGATETRLVRYAGDSWQDVYSADEDATELVVAPDGAHAALVGDAPGAPLRVIELGTGQMSNVDPTPAMSRRVAFAADGAALLQVRDGQLVRTTLATDETELLGSVGPAEALAGTRRGPVALLSNGDVVRYAWGGEFHIPAVPLVHGHNLLVATALDDAGGRSPPSEPISVTVDGTPADLAVTRVSIQPSVPVAGDTVEAIVTVRNLGSEVTPATSLIVKDARPDGTEVELPSVGLGALQPGGTTSAIVRLGVAGAEGTHQVIAVADPAGSVPDVDRSNNLARAAYTIVASRELQVAVSVAPASVQVNGQFTATVTVQNPGAPVDATLVTRLADSSGAVVSEASPSVYLPLPGSATTTARAVLSAGTSLAGGYQIRAVLTPAGGAPKAVTVPVTVEPEVAATLMLSADRFRYPAAGEVTLDSLVTNTSRNAPLAGATHHLEILDAAGVIRWTGSSGPIPTLWMNGASAVSTRLPAATLGAGDFVACSSVELDGAVLARASTPFTVLATPELKGMLAVAAAGDPPAVAAGSSAPVSITFLNAGTVNSPATAGRVLLLSTLTDQVLSTHDLSVPALAPGASSADTAVVATAGLALGTYSLVLVAELQGAAATLATTQFRVVDASPPVLAILSPAQETYVRASVAPRVRAFDSAAGVAAVRATVSGTSFEFTRQTGTTLDGIWSGTIPLAADGPYDIAVSAADALGNDGRSNPAATNPLVLHVVRDSIAPVVALSGAADGACVKDAVTLQASAVDANPAGVEVWLDGGRSASGVTVADEGRHTVTAQAIDRAGNQDTEVVRFTVDRTRPTISISGVSEGAYYAEPVEIRFSATDASSTLVSAELDHRPFENGDSATAEEQHLLEVAAVDCAGNRSTRSVAFVVQTTPPEVTLTGFVDGSYVNHSVAPGYTVSSPYLDHVEATLDLVPFEVGMIASSERMHVFTVVAFDKAGNSTKRSGSFTVDLTPPQIVVTGVTDASAYPGPVSPGWKVIDENPGSTSALLDRDRFESGSVVAAQGVHSLTVQAEDLAGNASTSTTGFTIDTEKPVIAITGVANHEVTSRDVVPVVTITDLDLVSDRSIELDHHPFTSGTVVSQEGDYILDVSAVDRVGHKSTASVEFAVDRTAPSITVHGVEAGAHYAGAVTPVFEVGDDHLLSSGATLNGEPFASGTLVSGARAYALVVTAQDRAGNTAVKTVPFVIGGEAATLEAGVSTRFARTLALVRSGYCDPEQFDVDRVSAFLTSAIGEDRVLQSTADEEVFLSLLRSGMFDTFIVVDVPLGTYPGKELCSRAFENGPPSFSSDSPSEIRRKDIARELTERLYGGRAGVVVMRSRRDAWQLYREILGADVLTFESASTLEFTEGPLVAVPPLQLRDRAVRLELRGATCIGVYGSAASGCGESVGAVRRSLGAGTAVFMGVDLSRTFNEADAALAMRLALDAVRPVSKVGPLGVVPLELKVASPSGDPAAWAQAHIPAPIQAVGAVPDADLDPTTNTVQWSLELPAGIPVTLWSMLRMPDVAGVYAVRAELGTGQHGSTAELSKVVDLTLSRTGTRLLADAQTLVSAIPATGDDQIILAEIRDALRRVQERPILWPLLIEDNLYDLLEAVERSKSLQAADGQSVRMALDELVAYWEARWYLF